MKIIYFLLVFMVCSACSNAQTSFLSSEKTADRNKQTLAWLLSTSPGPAFRLVPEGTTYALSLDHMPCYIPNVSAQAKIPVYCSTMGMVNTIPNPYNQQQGPFPVLVPVARPTGE